MNKMYIFFFFLLIFENSVSQVTGQNGSAVNSSGSVITGNISIPANLTVQGGLNIGDSPLYVSQLYLGMEYRSSGNSGFYIGDIGNSDVSTFITGWGDNYNASSVIGLLEGEIVFRTFSSDIMRIKNGNVGIGTNNPDEKLSVNGKIHTKEVRVDLIGWPDYVFNEKYNLKPLNEVEKYIKDHGHLENIQSAEEVEANGILLGEMNKKLLEKIEELTLYLIKQDKDIDELKKQLKRLEEIQKI